LIPSVNIRASYGLELVDGLTGGPLLGSSSVRARGTDVKPFLVRASRWVFEGLAPPKAVFEIEADSYVPRVLTTGSAELPDAVADKAPAVLARVMMMPRTGYPFPPTLTRVVGQVRRAGTLAPIEGLTVTVTARHDDVVKGTSVTGASAQVVTTDDGQYTFWFFADPAKTPHHPSHVVAAASGAVNGPLALPLLPHRVTAIPALLMP
jgi:hypothetical protein